MNKTNLKDTDFLYVKDIHKYLLKPDLGEVICHEDEHQLSIGCCIYI